MFNKVFMQGEISTATKIYVMVFWVMTPFSDVVGYQCFGGPYYLHLQDEYGGSVVIQNIGILPHH
jgi:hypothetical protein